MATNSTMGKLQIISSRSSPVKFYKLQLTELRRSHSKFFHKAFRITIVHWNSISNYQTDPIYVKLCIRVTNELILPILCTCTCTYNDVYHVKFFKRKVNDYHNPVPTELTQIIHSLNPFSCSTLLVIFRSGLTIYCDEWKY